MISVSIDIYFNSVRFFYLTGVRDWKTTAFKCIRATIPQCRTLVGVFNGPNTVIVSMLNYNVPLEQIKAVLLLILSYYSNTCMPVHYPCINNSLQNAITNLRSFPVKPLVHNSISNRVLPQYVTFCHS